MGRSLKKGPFVDHHLLKKSMIRMLKEQNNLLKLGRDDL